MPNYRPGRSSRSGGNAGEQVVSFTMHDAQRINRAVGIVERDRRMPNPSSLPRAAGGGGGGGGVVLIYFLGGWSKNTTKQVSTESGESISVRNNIAEISTNYSGTRDGYAVMVSDTYHLIAFECR